MTLEVFPLWMLYKEFQVPLGSIVMWPIADPNKLPTGWMICDGRSLSRTTYKELWNQVRLTYTSVDDGSNFNIPNLSNTFLKGTSPNYDTSTDTYSWSSNDLPGTTEAEGFNHSLVSPAITPNIQLSSYSSQVSYQVTTSGQEIHSHSDAVQEGYRYTTIDDAASDTAGHDHDTSATNGAGAKHLPGGASRRTSSDSSSYDWPYGSYFDRNGYAKSSAMAHSFQGLYTWDHNHTPKSRNSSNSQQGIIGGVNGTSLVNESGGGQLTPGTGSVGNHTHVAQYSIERTHNHTISGQTGSIQLSGFDSKIEPKHMPMLYIIYTGVS